MAIINCPECDQKISSTVKQCIHCGAKITVCPECEKVFIDDVETCSSCGYSFSKKHNQEETTRSEENDNTLKTARQAKEKWISENPIRNAYSTTYGRGSCLLVLVSFLVVFALFALINKEIASLDLLDYNSTVSNLKTYLLAGSVMLILSSIYNAIEKVLCYHDFSKWAARSKIDTLALINRSFSLDFSKFVPEEVKKESQAIQLCLNAEIYDKDIGMKSARNGLFATSISFSIVKTFFLYLFAVSNLKNFLGYVVIYSLTHDNAPQIGDFDFSTFENWWIFAVWLVLVIIDEIVIRTSNNRINKIHRAWMDKHMPENVSKYNTYIKDPSKYIQ